MTQNNQTQGELSRRNFFHLTGIGLLGLIWPRQKSKLQLSIPEQQGRVIPPTLKIYQTPSLNSKQVNQYPQDTVLTITHVTIGDIEPAHNRVWYRIGGEGYAHSGGIQPVQTSLNEPQGEFPRSGSLAEVTVPYTDAHYHPGSEYPFAYRLYYETTHWVDKTVEDKEGNAWYRVREDKWDFIYYLRARHVRVYKPEDLQPLAPEIPGDLKRIEVDLERQVVSAYEGNSPVFMTRAATGAKFSNGTFSTPSGRHMTYHKRPSRHMAAGNLAANGYDLPGVPWVCYITEKGVAFHGTYWHNDFGRPRSHGCINLSSQAAKWLYLWTLPIVPPEEQRIYEKFGTRVDVF
jgi:hypothetical protein